MRLKLDENLPTSLVPELVALGHQADTVVDEGLAGTPDVDVSTAATADSRVLVTLDLDFSNIRRYPPGSNPGIIVLRLAKHDIDTVTAAMARLFFQYTEESIAGNLVVVSDRGIRIRRPPTP